MQKNTPLLSAPTHQGKVRHITKKMGAEDSKFAGIAHSKHSMFKCLVNTHSVTLDRFRKLHLISGVS